MIAIRALRLRGAVLRGGACGGALLGPLDRPRAAGRLQRAATLAPRLQSLIGPTLWRTVAAPLMVRPVWLPMAALGLVSGGIALSLNTARPSQTRRRRS